MNSQMIVRTCCKLTLDDYLQPDSFAVLNVVPVLVVSIVMLSCCNFQSSEDRLDSIAQSYLLYFPFKLPVVISKFFLN